MSIVKSLPAQFAELAPYAPIWALATETERNIQRHTVGMDAIYEYSKAILPRVDEVVTFLNAIPLSDLDSKPEAMTLMQMLLSLAEIAPAVEFYKQPAVIDGYDSRRFVADETFVMSPHP